MTAAPLVSIVVIGRNEGDRLARCLLSVQQIEVGVPLIEDAPAAGGGPALSAAPATRPRNPLDRFATELIYVDSGSTDSSLTVAQSLGAQTIALHPQRPTAALARNAGWRTARGEFILFLDGDTELNASFLSGALPSFADPGVAVVWGHRREKHPELSLYDRALDLDWIYPPGAAPFCGGDALFRRDVLLQTGGFDDTIVAGEEPELCGRIRAGGHTVLHVDLPMTLHVLGIRGFRQYWKRAMRAGHAYAEVAARFTGTANPLWTADLRRARAHAALLTLLAATVLSAAIVMRSALPLLAGLAVMAALVVRTAWKARWKSENRFTLLLYGLHSHLQQIPIAYGSMLPAEGLRTQPRTDRFDYKTDRT